MNVNELGSATPSGTINPETPTQTLRILSKSIINRFVSRSMMPRPASWGECLLRMQRDGYYDPQRDEVRVNDDTSDLWVGDIEIPYRVQIDGIEDVARYAAHSFYVGLELKSKGITRAIG